MSEEKFCESCGMPMRSANEFGGGKTTNLYCVHCCDNEGNLKSYETILSGMTQFAVKTMGVSKEEAQQAAIENMAKLPAWNNN